VHSTDFDVIDIGTIKSGLTEDKELTKEQEEDLDKVIEAHKRNTLDIIKDTINAGGIAIIETMGSGRPKILDLLEEKGLNVGKLRRERKIHIADDSKLNADDSPTLMSLPKDAEFYLHGYFRNLCVATRAFRLRRFLEKNGSKADIHVIIGTPTTIDIKHLRKKGDHHERVYDKLYGKVGAKKINLIQFRKRMEEIRK
jgi:hypothetical protein